MLRRLVLVVVVLCAAALGIARTASADNTATNSIGTVQVGQTSVDPTATASAPATQADASAPTSVGGSGGNTASNSVGTVQAGGGNSASGSAGTVQAGPVSSTPSASASVAGNRVSVHAPAHVGVSGSNSTGNSIGTIQAGGGNTAGNSVGAARARRRRGAAGGLAGGDRADAARELVPRGRQHGPRPPLRGAGRGRRATRASRPVALRGHGPNRRVQPRPVRPAAPPLRGPADRSSARISAGPARIRGRRPGWSHGGSRALDIARCSFGRVSARSASALPSAGSAGGRIASSSRPTSLGGDDRGRPPPVNAAVLAVRPVDASARRHLPFGTRWQRRSR
jgi:hypothetical protein